MALPIALALAACNNEEPLPDGTTTDGGDEIRITATVGHFSTGSGTDTRATISEEGTGSFVDGDKIGLWTKTATSAQYSNMQGLSYGNGLWSGFTQTWADLGELSIGSPCHFFALYPQPGTGNVLAAVGETVTFTVQTDQSSDANYKASDLLTAFSEYTSKPVDGNVELPFKHAMARIKITLTGAKANTDATVVIKNVNTQCRLTFGGGIDQLSATTNIIPKKATDGDYTFYALVPPQTLGTEGLKLSVTASGRLMEAKVGGENNELKSKVLEKGQQYSITLNITTNE